MRGRARAINRFIVKKHFATIIVNYPDGCICEATNGEKTLAAEDQSGYWSISVLTPKELPEKWIITVTQKDGTTSKTKEQEVFITEEGQVENVILNFRKYIYKANAGFQNGYSANLLSGYGYHEALGGAQYLDITNSIPGDVVFVGDIEAEGYSTVNMTIVQTGGTSGVIFALQSKQQTEAIIYEQMLESLATAVAPVGSINKEPCTLTIDFKKHGINTSDPLYLCSMHYNRPARIYDVWLE